MEISFLKIPEKLFTFTKFPTFVLCLGHRGDSNFHTLHKSLALSLEREYASLSKERLSGVKYESQGAVSMTPADRWVSVHHLMVPRRFLRSRLALSRPNLSLVIRVKVNGL